MERQERMHAAGCGPGVREGGEPGRRRFLKGVGFACLGLLPWLSGCDRLMPQPGGEAGAAARRLAGGGRPPIDLAAPPEIRTATFALG